MMLRDMDASKKIFTVTTVFVFDVELFTGVRHEIITANSLKPSSLRSVHDHLP